MLTATRKPLSNPANIRYYERMYDESNPVWAQAKQEATLAAGAGTALSFGTGLPTTAQTSEAIAARQAGKLPYSSYQIIQAPKTQQPLMQAANDRAIKANPAECHLRRPQPRRAEGPADGGVGQAECRAEEDE